MEFVEGEANSKYFDGYINAPASKSDADIEVRPFRITAEYKKFTNLPNHADTDLA